MSTSGVVSSNHFQLACLDRAKAVSEVRETAQRAQAEGVSANMTRDIRVAIEKLRGVERYMEHKTTLTGETRELLARGHIYNTCLFYDTTLTATLDNLLLRSLESLLSLASVNFMDDQRTDFWKAQNDESVAIQALTLWNECAAHLSDDDGGNQALQAIKDEQARLIIGEVNDGASSDEDWEPDGDALEDGGQSDCDVEMEDV